MEIRTIIKEPSWEAFLLDNQPSEEFRQYYLKRLKENSDAYWQTLAEAETAYLLHFKFKIPVLSFSKKTVGEKDVDLIAKLADDEIFVEVTTSQYKSGKNSDLQQDAKFIRAIKHASKKFLTTSTNLLVVYDEQLSSQFYDPSFMHDDVPTTYFNSSSLEDENGKVIDIKKISGLLLFGQRKLMDLSRDYKLWKNDNAYKPFYWSLPLSVVEATGLQATTKRGEEAPRLAARTEK